MTCCLQCLFEYFNDNNATVLIFIPDDRSDEDDEDDDDYVIISDSDDDAQQVVDVDLRPQQLQSQSQAEMREERLRRLSLLPPRADNVGARNHEPSGVFPEDGSVDVPGQYSFFNPPGFSSLNSKY